MTEQASLWQAQQQSSDFAELCNALYEREINILAQAAIQSSQTLQSRIKSLPHYIKRTAHLMIQARTPLTLDTQNATWSSKQSSKMPLTSQEIDAVWRWYASIVILPGLVVPIAVEEHIVLDSVDRIDSENSRFRTNVHGWFKANELSDSTNKNLQLLKPNKKVMMAACAGHCWQDNKKIRPIIPSLRELLLSCAINWRNFKQPLAF